MQILRCVKFCGIMLHGVVDSIPCQAAPVPGSRPSRAPVVAVAAS